MKYFPLFCAIVWIFSACQGGKQNMVSSQTGDTIPLRYAENLTLVAYPEYTVATLRNPWDTLRTLHTYILVPAAEPLPAFAARYGGAYPAFQSSSLFVGTLRTGEQFGSFQQYRWYLRLEIYQTASRAGRR